MANQMLIADEFVLAYWMRMQWLLYALLLFDAQLSLDKERT